jgi:hypothetical protein
MKPTGTTRQREQRYHVEQRLMLVSNLELPRCRPFSVYLMIHGWRIWPSRFQLSHAPLDTHLHNWSWTISGPTLTTFGMFSDELDIGLVHDLIGPSIQEEIQQSLFEAHPTALSLQCAHLSSFSNPRKANALVESMRVRSSQERKEANRSSDASIFPGSGTSPNGNG